MARKDYFASAAPEPWQVLGLTLRPFSVGHYIKLRRLDCAFVADDERPATVKDLVVGVSVCSMASHPDQNRDEFWQWFNRRTPESIWGRVSFTFETKAARLLNKEHLSPAERDLYRLGKKCGPFDFKSTALSRRKTAAGGRVARIGFTP
jgi:hypothetical protein